LKPESDVGGIEEMNKIEKSIQIELPVRIVYDQWTQFEEFPKFMEGVKKVEQLDDKRLRWRAEIGGVEEEWIAEIIEQVPDKRISWHSTSGARNDGVVTFAELAENISLVTLRLAYDPAGPVENVGNALGVVEHRVEGDLKRFKEYVESRGSETGAWRGEIHEGRVVEH
jgi:uncharacterized membrane protein